MNGCARGQIHVVRWRGFGQTVLLIGPGTQIVVLATSAAKGSVGVGGAVDAVTRATGAFDNSHAVDLTHRWALNLNAQGQFKRAVGGTCL